MKTTRLAAAIAAAGVMAAAGAYAADAAPRPERVLWGDEHVHTGWSADAGLGGATLGPQDAVRFALGEAVTSSSGQNAKLQVPLDWVAVTDHSDGMGTINELQAGNAEFMADPTAKRWYEMMKQGGEAGRAALIEAVSAQSNHQLPKVFMDPKWMVSAWTKTIDIMERYNQPGKFTAFTAYEWTSNGDGGDNLHRNVILRDDGARGRQVLPLTTFQSPDPATLWQWLANYETKTGGQALAIPHNGNLNGVAKTPGMINTEYAREALKSGMRIQNTLGVNPFTIGAAGGTDTHNALSAPIENNFWGKFVASEPSAGRWDAVYKKDTAGFVRKDWTQSAQGYTGVWATANTREAIWDAMKRRETYASSGPRILVRFFGGYTFKDADAKADKLVAAGYARGVPMGGELKGGARKTPTFLIAAMKDPAGANLDRAQIVKGWVDAAGNTHEAIYDVAWSDAGKRKPVNGKLPPVGDTVDLTTATYRNSIGASELIGRFEDPNFDPQQRAFYYVRVLEIPTPRWTAYDAVRYKATMTPDVTMKLQERAVTSPIWYDPA